MSRIFTIFNTYTHPNRSASSSSRDSQGRGSNSPKNSPRPATSARISPRPLLDTTSTPRSGLKICDIGTCDLARQLCLLHERLWRNVTSVDLLTYKAKCDNPWSHFDYEKLLCSTMVVCFYFYCYHYCYDSCYY